MTPNETMVLKAAVAQTKSLVGVSFQLLKLIQLQLARENGTSDMPRNEYLSQVSNVMNYVTPILDIVTNKE